MRIIKAPMFVIDGIECNQYTLMALQLDVAKGIVKPPKAIVDVFGNTRTIRPDGRLSGPLHGYGLETSLLMALVDPFDEEDWVIKSFTVDETLSN